jgi:tetratricopeptide (TPR) repeat protein
LKPPLAQKKELDRAIKDFEEAIRLQPQLARAYGGRAGVYFYRKDYDRAIEDYNHWVRLEPKSAHAYSSRAFAFSKKKDYEHAAADFQEAVRIGVDDPASYNNLAWILATCSNAKQRDGKKAVEYAKKACELTRWKDWNLISTLAAAYAESGDFDNAVKTESKANELAPANEKAALTKRLDLYKSKKPYRDE